ncbi:MAG: hypothetical protein IKS15_02680 [Opitutales bacterium]|nr:hypothetical protein [Opitutales bacterium]
MASKLKQIQSEVEAHIDSVLPQGVKVLSRLRGNVSNDVAAAIARLGICAMVFPPSIAGIKPNVASGVLADNMAIQIRIIENPALNKSGFDAYEILECLIGSFAFRTSDGTTIYLREAESADPDSQKIVEFVVTLSFKYTFPKTS